MYHNIERWKPIRGYEGLYSVSNLGRVRREKRVLINRRGIRQVLVAITSNPLELARAEVKKFELKEDYIDQLDDKVFYLDVEAEEAATVEESTVIEEHEIQVSDWLTGTKKTLRMKQKKSLA